MKTCKRGLHLFEGRRCIECCKLRYKEYCDKNKDKVNAKARERYAKDPESYKEATKKCKEKNKERYSAARKSRRIKAKQEKNRQEALKALGLSNE